MVPEPLALQGEDVSDDHSGVTTFSGESPTAAGREGETGVTRRNSYPCSDLVAPGKPVLKKAKSCSDLGELEVTKLEEATATTPLAAQQLDSVTELTGASGGQPEAATPSEADIRSSDENPGEKDTAPKKEELDNEILLNRLNNLLGPI